MSSPRLLRIVLLVLPILGAPSLSAQIYKNPKAPLEDRVKDLFERLNPDEKALLLTGAGFTTQPIPRLDVPSLAMADAGQGVRGGPDSTLGPATAFPSGVAMASTWDTDLIRRIGTAIGEEARNKGAGAEMLLGPAVNIHRSPLGGRNGEYFSEDPFLTSRLAVAFIQGVQDTGTAACIKHFACNNEEADRMDVDVRVGERALREIYLPAFEAGVKEGKAWALMSAYNKINGRHASANPYLLIDVLKKGWGFDGMVMSDWGGVHEAPVAQAGNDVEMPGGEFATVANINKALADKTMTQDAVDDSVRRILRTIIRTGLLDGPPKPDPKMVNSAGHKKLAYEAAAKSVVLLRNEGGLLPLDRKTVKSIAVIGEAAQRLQIGALGSPEVTPIETVELLDGIKKLGRKEITVRYADAGPRSVPVAPPAVTRPKNGKPGFRAEYFANTKLEGEPACLRAEDKVHIHTAKSPAPDVPPTRYSVRWTAALTAHIAGEYTFMFTGSDGFRVLLDGKPIIERWSAGPKNTLSAQINLEKGKSYDLAVEFFQDSGEAVAELNWRPPSLDPYANAIAAAKKSDVAIVAVSTRGTEGEGNDRPSMELPGDQAGLIRAVAAANPRTIVVLNNGTPVAMKDWINDVPAVIEAWFPGQEGGAALAAVLFGDINPSGKLPDTFAVKRGDYPDTGHFPGRNGSVNYDEGIYVGYRHFDKQAIAPLFPFGHGLSYTTFDYRNLKLAQSGDPIGTAILASVDITNTGERKGEEVVQLYIRDENPKVDKPTRELKGFSKVELDPGETKTVAFTLTPRDFSYFDVPGRQWKADASTYDIEIGASSRDIRAKSALKLDADFTEKVPLSKDHSKD